MHLVVAHAEPQSSAQWAAELRREFPQALVTQWPAGAQGPGHAALAASEARSTAGAPRADYAVGWQPPADFFARNPGLRAFFSAAAGVDHLLLHPGLPPSLPLVRLEDAGMGRQMAAYCCHEVVRLFYRYAEYEALQREGRWQELPLQARRDFAVGIFGMGVLGREVARALLGMGFRVLGHSRTARAVADVECSHGDAALPGFLAQCRVLILMAPLTAETRDLVDADFLSKLPAGAWLVNVARGALVVEPALLDALASGRLAGATLDVFRTEPLPSGHAFWSHPRIRITPHVAAVTLVDEGAQQVADKIRRLERGEPVGGVVERGRGY